MTVSVIVIANVNIMTAASATIIVRGNAVNITTAVNVTIIMTVQILTAGSVALILDVLEG